MATMPNFDALIRHLLDKYPDNYARGKAFEPICKWFLEQDPYYAQEFQNVPNKEGKVGTITIPVFIGEGEDAETALSSSRFEPVWGVLRALRDHDDTLRGELDALRYELGRRGSIGVPLQNARSMKGLELGKT